MSNHDRRSNHDKTRLFKLMENDIKLKRLYEDHVNFKEELKKLKGKSFLTSDEERLFKKLKFLKLRNYENIESLTKAA